MSGAALGVSSIPVGTTFLGVPGWVMPTGMEETPKAALHIHCLQLGGGVALT